MPILTMFVDAKQGGPIVRHAEDQHEVGADHEIDVLAQRDGARIGQREKRQVRAATAEDQSQAGPKSQPGRPESGVPVDPPAPVGLIEAVDIGASYQRVLFAP